MGGARYLAGLYDRLPEEIIEPDRTWIALASYNVGFGHVMDARRIAVDKGLDPNLWSSLQETLPLLAKRQYYRHARYGYARGREPVRYVQRIRDFRDILEQRLAQTAENALAE
jgi:membrane-bound lytic murein transglycosylase F